jgi:UPF0755 protein
MRILSSLLILLFIALMAVSGTLIWLYMSLSGRHDHTKTNSVVSIPRGANIDKIVRTLQEDGIIDNALAVKIFLKVTSRTELIKAGDYRFNSPISAIEVLNELEKGGTEHKSITIIEGWNRFDIADAMFKSPTLKLQNQTKAMALLTDVSLIKDLDPSAKSLEGYLFPSTYYLQEDTSAKQLVAQMVAKFRSVYNKEIAFKAKLAKLTPHQTVTMASVVETESKLKEERPIVSSVIYNRIAKNMNLSMDSTVVYASKLAGKWKGDGKVYKSDLALKSPYNTRLYKGLPPGPVANPGLESLLAAVEPAKTNYIYYVRDPYRPDGKHDFFATAQGFELGVQKLRKWEADQRKAGLR